MNKLITILMTCYNSEAYIIKAIESVINQTYTNWELIIINDYSFDNTCELLKQYSDNNKIIIIHNSMNFGTYYSLNEGLKISKGDYITKLDSDDVYDKNKLKNQLQFCINNNLEACTCNILRGYLLNNKIIYNQEANDSSIMFSRKVFDKIGYFDNARFDCDSEFFYRLKKNFIVKNLDENLYYARYRADSLTASNDTGTSIKQFGSRIRSKYKENYKKYHSNYIDHPKYIRNYSIHPFQKTCIDLEILGKHNVINQNDEGLKIEFFEKGTIENIYKLNSDQNIRIENIKNYNIKITNIDNKEIEYFIKSNYIEFSTCEKYIKIKVLFNIGIYDFYPLILS